MMRDNCFGLLNLGVSDTLHRRYYSCPVHPAYNPYFSAYFFSRNNIFFLTTNQSIVFFNRLVSTTERGHLWIGFLKADAWIHTFATGGRSSPGGAIQQAKTTRKGGNCTL
jgi:hypothetical protein